MNTNLNQKKNQMALESAAVRNFVKLQDLMQQLQEKVNNLPSPDSDGYNWGNVGDMGHLIEQLEEIVRDDS